jgi:hypothetical protein
MWRGEQEKAADGWNGRQLKWFMGTLALGMRTS